MKVKVVAAGALLALAASLSVMSPASAQNAKAAAERTPPPGDASAALPGRSPTQPIDEAYTRKIREYTTETFFLSPLVDYLPASATVPTPTAVLGDIAGAPNKLPYSRAPPIRIAFMA
jgi:hypothetical protein